MNFKCPGALSFSQPHPDIFNCPKCGQEVEMWSDEAKTTCSGCGETVVRGGENNCLDWCKYAKDCVGGQVYGKYMQNKTAILKEKLLKDLEEHFGDDKKRIDHAKKVMSFAGELLKHEKADWHIVIPASILHDVGIKEAEKKYGSSAGNYQEKEGPAIARQILINHGFKREDIEEICAIVAHHHSPGKIDTLNFKVLYDADWLVNLKDEVDIKDKEALKRKIDKIFLTGTGKETARKLYL